MFDDSNNPGAVPTGASPVVAAIHAAGHYSICYVEAGAYQTGFPDDSDFAAADYGDGAQQYAMQGWSGEWWFDLSGFANYVAGTPSTLTGAAVNIAAGLNDRFQWCKLEGQDAVEPDDLDGYTNTGDTGVAGGGWGLTQADSAGFERWIAYQVHADGLAVFQKNDPANASSDEPLFDGVISEECNAYNDPCAGPGGDWTAYLAAGKPVLNAEYTSDSETASKFCPTDEEYGIWGALFDLNLDGATYDPCWSANNTL
ncbi:MAG: endo alpha-1,4 polygalactosaminidase [Solirubrobacteraceae bacterium]